MRKVCRKVTDKKERGEDNGEFQPSARPAQKLAGQPKLRCSKPEEVVPAMLMKPSFCRCYRHFVKVCQAAV